MVKKAYSKLWILKRLKKEGASLDDLKDVFIKQIRSILEFGVPVWNCSITLDEVTDIERVQKAFLYITLGEKYYRYESALEIMELETIEERRLQLCRTFATRAYKHPKHTMWFQQKMGAKTRSSKPELKIPLARLDRYKGSPIPYLTSLLNST